MAGAHIGKVGRLHVLLQETRLTLRWETRAFYKPTGAFYSYDYFRNPV